MQGEWTGMPIREKWRLHCTSQWRWQTPLSEHVYCVAVEFKMTEWVEQRICIRFCIKLECSSAEIIWMTHKAAAMSNWWLAASSWQCPCPLMHHISCRDFWWDIKSPRWLSPLHSRFGDLQLLAFSKTKKTYNGKRFQTIDEIQENTTGQLMETGELCQVPRCLLRRGQRHHCPMCNVSCIFFNECLYFSYYMTGYFLDRYGYIMCTVITLCRTINQSEGNRKCWKEGKGLFK